ncbi:Rab guanine nucleotide exchange factor SEC2 [Yarrowia sp. C11]|nr:Rab guanine nucleotide exchange factor SEC2 [Yarrowia sp. E02]KAG5371448.1 Rab guanine nucleotide exchange factor SEC2 [Yarrowia sp. C11]
MSVETQSQTQPRPHAGPAQMAAASAASSGHVKELTQEVSSLSTRLLQAMETQSELEEELGREKRDKDRAIVENKELKTEVKNLREEMQELSAELFDEANTMVSDARRDAAKEVAETKKRNDQLKVQLEERDNLLESLQAQLGALKMAMQERDEEEDRLQNLGEASDEENEEENVTKRESSIHGTNDGSDDGFESAAEGDLDIRHSLPGSANGSSTNVSGPPPVANRPRLSRAPSSRKRMTTIPTAAELNSPSRPHLRQDLASFRDFIALVRQAAKQREAAMESSHTSASIHAAGPTSSSTSSTDVAATSLDDMPHTPPTHQGPFKHDDQSPLTSIYSSYMSPQSHKEPPPLQLKDTRFFKKFISEDFEPTLRLDLAPGLSWLARRAVQMAILDGTIVIDPIAAVNELYGVNMMTDMWLNGGFSEAAGAPRDANGELIKDAHSGDATFSKDVVAPDHPTKQRPASALVSFARDAKLLKPEKVNEEESHITPPMSREEARAQAIRDLESRASHESSRQSHDSRTSSSNNVSPPMATISACSLCGESRNHSLVYARLHYLRTANAAAGETGESGEAGPNTSALSAGKGYPLCGYCLVRVRAVCDYLTFLRSVKDGVWKVDGVASENKVWGECIRLKERMFWARVGGGFL